MNVCYWRDTQSPAASIAYQSRRVLADVLVHARRIEMCRGELRGLNVISIRVGLPVMTF